MQNSSPDHLNLNQEIPAQNQQPPSQESLDPDHTLYDAARSQFIIKVYSILGMELLFTAICVTLTIVIPEISDFLQKNTWLWVLMSITTIITFITLLCKKEICERYPQNMIGLAIFTMAESYCVSTICSMYTPESVILAAVVTAVSTISITLYVKYSKSSFLGVKSMLSSLGVSFFTSIVFISMISFWLRIPFLTGLISVVLAFLYPLYLIYDTKMILDGDKHRISLDQYVLASLFLYLDIIGIFLDILRLLGKRN